MNNLIALRVGKNASDASLVNVLRAHNIRLDHVSEEVFLKAEDDRLPDVPDVILLEQNLSEAISTLQRWREDKKHTGIPLILAVTDSNQDVWQKIADDANAIAGVNDLIRCPIEPTELAARIRYVTAQKHPTRLLREMIHLIQAETVEMHRSLGGIFANLPVLLELFSDGGDRSLVLFLDYLKYNMAILSPDEEKAVFQTIKSKFEQADIEHAELFADKLAKLGYTASIDEFIPFFLEVDRHPGAILVLYQTGLFWKQLASIESRAIRTLELMPGQG